MKPIVVKYMGSVLKMIVITLILAINLLFFCSCDRHEKKEDSKTMNIVNSLSRNIKKSTLIHFRNPESNDTLFVSIVGKPVYEAILTIRIISDQNKVLYEYIAPFKKHVAVAWYDTSLVDAATNFVDQLIENHIESVSNLPHFNAPQEGPIALEFILRVDSSAYRNIIQSNKIVFRHPTHYEAWRYIAYDEASDKGIIILESGI